MGERWRNSIASRLWRPYSRLFLANDGADWVLAQEMREVGRIARRLGIKVASTEHAGGARGQSVFYASQFVLLDPRHFDRGRVAIAYFHGRAVEDPTFASCFDQLQSRHGSIARVQVSHSAMRDFVLSSGIDPKKVFLIPIGVAAERFRPPDASTKLAARARLGIPASAAVVGSFQKDGVGWGAGLEPKLIKGPDVLLDVLAGLRSRMSELFVLISGPARGYVRRGLEGLGIPHRHIYLQDPRRIHELYEALDLYLVTSREEGGPKAVLESMAAGVPLVTTRVGQAVDLVRHRINGWMTDVEDREGLLHFAAVALVGGPEVEEVIRAGRATALANSYDRQDPLWSALFAGFVERR